MALFEMNTNEVEGESSSLEGAQRFEEKKRSKSGSLERKPRPERRTTRALDACVSRHVSR